MTDEDVVPYLRTRLADFEPVGTPERLSGGNLNFVWRVQGQNRSVVVKHAPPHIAVDPDTPLDPDRLLIEARCLDALGPDGSHSDLASEAIRAPHVLDVNPDEYVLVMEDLGDRPPLGRWLHEKDPSVIRSTAPVLGRRLGRFIGRLHAITCGDATAARAFDNRSMQETRLAVQYQGVADMLERGGIADATPLGAKAEALGTALLEPGRCLTMGDLWPPSVLVEGDTLRLIDWELAHYGRPLQDVAHWRAHLWMQRQHTPSGPKTEAVEALWRAFRSAYDAALGPERERLWSDDETRAAAIHAGAEILVRAVGPFQEGYVYAGQAPDHPAVQDAVQTAARCLREPAAVDLLSTDGGVLS